MLLHPNDLVVCLGDSITEAADGYVSQVANHLYAHFPGLPVLVQNAGVSGNRIVDLLDRLDRDVIDREPQWVTVSVGINDVWHDLLPHHRGVSLPDFSAGYAKLVARLKARTQARVFLMTTTVIGEELDNAPNRTLSEYNAVVRELAERESLGLIDLNEVFREAIRRGRSANPVYHLTYDGVHPTPAGHQLIASAVLKAFEAW
ncbi:MAG: SGNH/GDSL hydrolase family protein [Chitinophagales bacterium]